MPNNNNKKKTNQLDPVKVGGIIIIGILIIVLVSIVASYVGSEQLTTSTTACYPPIKGDISGSGTGVTQGDAMKAAEEDAEKKASADLALCDTLSTSNTMCIQKESTQRSPNPNCSRKKGVAPNYRPIYEEGHEGNSRYIIGWVASSTFQCKRSCRPAESTPGPAKITACSAPDSTFGLCSGDCTVTIPEWGKPATAKTSFTENYWDNILDDAGRAAEIDNLFNQAIASAQANKPDCKSSVADFKSRGDECTNDFKDADDMCLADSKSDPSCAVDAKDKGECRKRDPNSDPAIYIYSRDGGRVFLSVTSQCKFKCKCEWGCVAPEKTPDPDPDPDPDPSMSGTPPPGSDGSSNGSGPGSDYGSSYPY